MVYLDNAASAPLCEPAKRAMGEAFACYGNPSSLHESGAESRRRIEKARNTIAECVNAEPEQVLFTSGGTEANSLAITGLLPHLASLQLTRIVTTGIEHASVYTACEQARNAGFVVTHLPCPSGLLDMQAARDAIHKGTGLVSVQYVNNELGTIQPIMELGELCRDRGVALHIDAVQAAGHIALHFAAMQADFVTISAHKLGGPKGIGVLLAGERRNLLRPCMQGGSQEQMLRPGTENLLGIVGMAAAIRYATENMERHSQQVNALKGYLLDRLRELRRCRIYGAPQQSQGVGIVNAGFGMEGETLALLLGSLGICVSAGSACSGMGGSVRVLSAAGYSREEAGQCIRISLSHRNSRADIDALILGLHKILE